MEADPVNLLIQLSRASHVQPTVAVTGLTTVLAWGLGWPMTRLPGLVAVVLAGQLSVGWSNDAHDADLDHRSQRTEKPVVQGALEARMLWWLAGFMLLGSCVGSWMIAGWIGGSFHVLALAAAWSYNLVLSRTAWSWVPYVVAFGSVPAFLAFGLDGRPPPWWLVVAVSLIGVSGHLANASGDIDRDARAGVSGLAVRIGPRRAGAGCWALLAIGTGILAGVALVRGWDRSIPALGAGAAIAAATCLGSWLCTRSSPRLAFPAVLIVTGVDCALVIAILRLSA